MTWLWLACSIVFEVAATLSLRASDGLKRKLWLVPVAVGYAAAFGFLALTLRAGMPLGVAYGLWSAIGVVAVALISRFVWNERLTRRMLLGIALVASGVLLVELG